MYLFLARQIKEQVSLDHNLRFGVEEGDIFIAETGEKAATTNISSKSRLHPLHYQAFIYVIMRMLVTNISKSSKNLTSSSKPYLVSGGSVPHTTPRGQKKMQIR
jgi:hypothetical protein